MSAHINIIIIIILSKNMPQSIRNLFVSQRYDVIEYILIFFRNHKFAFIG